MTCVPAVQKLMCVFPLLLNQCHGLWDEDDTRSEAKKTLCSPSDSDSTEKPPVQRERSSVTRNTLMETTHIRMPRKLSNTPSTMRRHSSSAGSHISHRSTRSRGGWHTHKCKKELFKDLFFYHKCVQVLSFIFIACFIPVVCVPVHRKFCHAVECVSSGQHVRGSAEKS